MSKGLYAFFLSGMALAVIALVAMAVDWSNLFQQSDPTPEQSTFTSAEVRKIIEDWPVAMAEIDKALKEYRAIGGSRTGESAIRRGVQVNTFIRLGWREGRAEYLISYLFMLRNALLKNTEQHRALGYFMEHYESNDAVSAELKELQIDQIEMLLTQINEAPKVDEFPPGDIELMARYFNRFHSMLVGYGRELNLAQR